MVTGTIHSPHILDVEKVSGGKKAVDWAALSENQDDMIDPKYLPADFVFRDPSKMKKTHYQALLEHWYGRQEDDDTETVFTFKGYWDPSRDSVMVANDKHPAHQKRSKPLAEKRQPGPRSIGSKPKRTNSKAAREANKPPKRNGPPGIRKGDEQWPVDSDSEDGDDDEDGEDDDEDDEGDEEAEPLPFSAPLRRGAPGIAKKARLPEPKAKARSNAGANSSKSKHPDQTSKTDKPEPRFTKRVLPRPAYRGIPSDAAASQMSPTAPKPVKEKPPRKPAPQYERPTTRSGAKRKVDDAELQAIGEPSKKKGKNNAVTKGGSKGKIFPKQK
jgi:hypothetical protein